jgi:ABC-type multidrug transport system ATPase subunit
VLAIQGVSLDIGGADSPLYLLQDVSVNFQGGGQLVAVLGPSGCGKSTLMKVIAGLKQASAGKLFWKGRDLDEQDFEPREIGYVPQFSIACEKLDVWECIQDAVLLRCPGLSAEEVEDRVASVLAEVGMSDLGEKRVEVLSGGQRRRLALGMELVSSPELLLCDEVTSGLDPRAEDEMTELMSSVASKGRLVLNITHSLRHLAAHQSVLVLVRGRVAYHASPEHLLYYFGVSHAEDLYPRLAERSPEEWAQSWEKRRETYYSLGSGGGASAGGDRVGETSEAQTKEDPHRVPGETVGGWTQFCVLLARRWRLFWRDRVQVGLQLALMLGFPCLVVVFALNGLPALRAAAELPDDPLKQVLSDFTTKLEYLRVGGLVSGLIMFQVVLLTLMGANNAAREVAGERLILEKEKFSGLSPAAFVAARVVFLAVLVLIQSVWMGLFVNSIIGMPGSLLTQVSLLVLVNAAMTAISLGISAVMSTAEQSSLVSVYLVGFQLPLSGAVLALPEWLGRLTRPFIASYWGWAGYLQTLQETRFYNAVLSMTQTPLMSIPVVVWVLGFQIVVGLVVAYVGVRSSKWE